MSQLYLDDFVAAAGNDRVGRFLHKLHRLLAVTKVRYGGHRWVAWTRAEWCADLQVSDHQFRLVLEKAKRAGLIVCEQHKFRNSTPLFVRLSPECVEKAWSCEVQTSRFGSRRPDRAGGKQPSQAGGKRPSRDGGKYPTRDGRKQPSQDGEKHPFLYKSVLESSLGSSVESSLEARAAAFAAASSEEESQDSPEEDSHDSQEKDSGFEKERDKGQEYAVVTAIDQGGSCMKADEFKAQANAWAPTPVDTLNPDRVASLEQVWSIGFHKRGTVPPAITMKARGQLKMLIRTWPRGSAPALLAFALANWVDVRLDAEYRFGAFNSPAAPELGYLVRFAHVVSDLFNKHGPASAGAANAPPSPPPPSIEPGNQSIGKRVAAASPQAAATQPEFEETLLTIEDVLALEREAA